MIGCSISGCFADMARGVVKPSIVSKIIAGTNHDFGEEHILRDQIAHYRGSAWEDCADEAERIFREFLDAGKIDQPRQTIKSMPDVQKMGRRWVDTVEEIIWMKDVHAIG